VRRFVAVRLLQTLVVLFIVATIAFFLIHLAPGDPFGFEDPRMTEAVAAHLRAQFGYDRPLLEQYGRYLANLARGELGYSHSLHVPVAAAIAVALPRTLVLMGIALTLSFTLGILLGAFDVRHGASPIGRFTDAATLFVYSLPDFWLSLMLLLTLAYWIPVFPPGGMIDVIMHDYMSPGAALLDRLKHVVLPVVALTLLFTALVARYQRVALLEVLPLDFVRTARAKGVSERGVVNRHALRNALLPMITLAGLTLPQLVGGAVFVERVFAWPGIGKLAVDAIVSADVPLILGTVLFGTLCIVIANLAVDVFQVFLDPRIRH